MRGRNAMKKRGLLADLGSVGILLHVSGERAGKKRRPWMIEEGRRMFSWRTIPSERMRGPVLRSLSWVSRDVV